MNQMVDFQCMITDKLHNKADYTKMFSQLMKHKHTCTVIKHVLRSQLWDKEKVVF